MRPVPKSLVRLGLPAVAVLGLALAGCGDPATPTPTPAPASTPATSPASRVAPVTGTAGSDGLTVRHLADDGTVHTVPVEDFPR